MVGNYINNLTIKSLQNDNIKTKHLSFIEEIFLDKSVEYLNIFTLNHVENFSWKEYSKSIL